MNSRYMITEGIIIKNTAFQDRDHITTLFTRDVGILKVFLKKKSYTPLNRVEVVYSERKSEICSCHEVSFLQSYPLIMSQLDHLLAACDLLQALTASQIAGKPAAPLYELLLLFLSKIHVGNYSSIFGSIFRLKILLHEGLIDFPLSYENQRFFDSDEQQVLELLTFSRRLNELSTLKISQDFSDKVRRFFIQLLSA